MAKVNIVLNTLSRTRDSVASQLTQMQVDRNDLNQSLKACQAGIDACIVDLALIEASILKLEEPVKVSKKKEK